MPLERPGRRARCSAVALVAAAMAGTPSLGVRLLSDLRKIFGTVDAMPTEAILKALHDLEEAPWCDLKGKPLDARRLANYLKSYGVTSKNIRFDEKIVKGYRKEELTDPWSRYVGEAHKEAATSATSATFEPDGVSAPFSGDASDAEAPGVEVDI